MADTKIEWADKVMITPNPPIAPIISDLSWIIVGGESGPGARPMHPDWVRSLHDQAHAFRIPFFFKQWGAWLPVERSLDTPGLFRPHHRERFRKDFGLRSEEMDRKLFEGRFHSWGLNAYSIRVGKTKAGRLLDGHLYDEFPPTSS